MAKPEREFNGTVGQKSMGTAGPEYIIKDLDKAFAMFDPNKTLPTGEPGGIGLENMQQGAVNDEVIGNREIDDTQEPTGNIGFLSTLLNGIANMIKSITGKTSWITKPNYDLEQLGNSTIDGIKNVGGDIDLVAGAGVEITPDSVGNKITFAAKNESITPGPHAETHSSIGSDPITPESIGAETPAGAQAKVNTLETSVKTGAAGLEVLKRAYPIGSIYINATVATNPATLLGFGTWEAFGAGRVLVGVDAGQTEFNSLGKTGGAKTHKLTKTEMPEHNHGSAGSHTHRLRIISGGGTLGGSSQTLGNTVTHSSANVEAAGSHIHTTEGSGESHNNLQPYITVYMWKRTV